MLRRIVVAYRSAFSGLPRAAWWLALAAFVNKSGTMVVPFLSLYLVRERGFAPEEAGGALALWGFGSVAGSFLGGWLCDRVAPMRVQAVSLLATALGFTVMQYAEAGAGIVGAMLFIGVFGEMLRPANVAAISLVTERAQRARGMALLRLAVNLGMAFGPAAGGALAALGYGWLFSIDAITCLCAALLLTVIFRRPLAVAPAAPSPAPPASPWRDRDFLALLGLMLLPVTVFFQLFSTSPLYLREHYGLDEGTIGALVSANCAFIVLFEMVLVHRLRGAKQLRVIAWGCLCIGLGFGILPFGSGIAMALVSTLLWTVGEMLAFPAALAYATARGDVRSVGAYAGAYTTLFATAQIIAPVAGMGLYARQPEALWYAALAVGLMSLGSFHLLDGALGRRVSRPLESH